MKKILLISILLTSLLFLGSSQIISINRFTICFDSTAAQQLFNEIDTREKIILLYNVEFKKSQDEVIRLNKENYNLNDSLNNLRVVYYFESKAQKKETNTWKGFTIVLSIMGLLISIFK